MNGKQRAIATLQAYACRFEVRAARYRSEGKLRLAGVCLQEAERLRVHATVVPEA